MRKEAIYKIWYDPVVKKTSGWEWEMTKRDGDKD